MQIERLRPIPGEITERYRSSQASSYTVNMERKKSKGRKAAPLKINVDNTYNPADKSAQRAKPKDGSKTYTRADETQFLIDNPDFDEMPASIEEFLGPGYLDIDWRQNPEMKPDTGIRDGVKAALLEIFGPDIDPKNISVVRTALFTGGIGIGKSTLAAIALAYCVHWVECLNNPQLYFGLTKGSRIAFMLMSTRDAQAKEVLFSDIKGYIENSQWFKDNCRSDPKRTNQLRFPKNIWIIPGNSRDTAFEGYNILCTDPKTEIFTRAGWKNYRELTVGEEILTLNHETGLSEWKPLQRINEFDGPEKMTLMEGSEFSSLTTAGHNWPVIHRYKDYRGTSFRREWKKTHTLNSEDRIPLSAIPGDNPTEQKYTDDLVEVVAWLYTEGNLVAKSSAVIYQKYGQKTCDRIRACLTRLFGPPSERFQSTSSKSTGVPLWRENVNNSPDSRTGLPKGLSEFRLNRDAGAALLRHAPNKVPSHEFLNSLTQSQLELFIDVSLLADNRGPDLFSQKNHAMSEAFAYAAILAGHSVSIRPQYQPVINKSGEEHGYDMLNVRLMKKDTTNPVAANKAPGRFSIQEVDYRGKVWCPTVENSTWLARRNGSVYFTGNCGVIDEGDSHTVTEEKDYAEDGYDTIYSRIESRYPDYQNGSHRGLLMVIGQMKKAEGFMARKKRELEKRKAERGDAAVFTMTIWESLGWERYRSKETGKIEVFYYDRTRRKIVPPAAALAVQSENIIKIPTAFLTAFESNPVKALKDLAGIPPAVEDPFIALTDRIDDAMKEYNLRMPDLLYPVNSSSNRPQFSDDLFATDRLKRALHVDIGYAAHGDALGMAMGHIPEMVEVDGELQPFILFDFLLRIKPSGGQKLMLSDFRKIIYELRDERKFNIAVVTFDGFQSQDSIQILQEKKFNTAEVSVDRNKGPYEDLRQAIYERRIGFPEYKTYKNRDDHEKVIIAKKELMELTDTGKKIDHPPKNGSKDVADAMAGVTYALMGNGSFRRGARGGRGAVDMAGGLDQGIDEILRTPVADQLDDRDLAKLLAGEHGNRLEKNHVGVMVPSPGYGLPAIEKNPFGLLPGRD